MPDTIEQRPLISPPTRTVVPTGADKELTATGDLRSRRRAAWRDLIEHTLERWLQNPDQLADEGVDAPSRTILRLAIDYAERLQEGGVPPPDTIVPDASGGIVFERRQNGAAAVLHFWDDGEIDFQLFDGDRLVWRKEL
jgi:hypothetical protein